MCLLFHGFLCFCSLFLAFAREHCLALAMATTSTLLRGGEEGLGVG